MTERPILMNEFSVRAILDGHKTQTRRVIKPQPQPNYAYASVKPTFLAKSKSWLFSTIHSDAIQDTWRCPYGVPGDRLWVREAWYWFPTPPTSPDDEYYVLYRATQDEDPLKRVKCKRDMDILKTCGWKPAIHMPREFSRLTLEITDIRVERVRHISAHDAICEGIVPTGYMGDPCDVADTAIDEFKMLWDDINAERGFSWESNPWVWAIAFEVVND